MKQYFTSESVTEGHPDKVCDQISDAILDEVLRQDPNGRVAAEVLATTGLIVVAGEISTTAQLDIQNIVRKTVCDIGYNSEAKGFNGNTCAVMVALDKQSPDIAMGVDNSKEYKDTDKKDEKDLVGAGDQGLVFGYASNETDELMPIAITYAHKLAKRLTDVRKQGILDYLRPDGKTQVTVEYKNGKVNRIDTILLSTSHDEGISQEQIKEDIINKVIKEVIPSELMDEKTKIYVNPTGNFVICGPVGDTGLTNRKIIVDTYGGMGHHGGGGLSGKDATKVDRSAAYMARYIAKNIVAAGLADKCEIQISYAIGMAKPISVFVDTFGTGKISDKEIIKIVKKVFDMRPAAIIETLSLREPIFQQTAAYGHFGRTDVVLPWEKTDKVDEIKVLAKDNKK